MSALARLQRAGLLPLVDQIANEHHVTVDDIVGSSRSTSIVVARRRVAQVLRSAPYNRSLTEIGQLLEKDYSSIKYMLRMSAAAREPPAATEVDDILLALAVARGALRCA